MRDSIKETCPNAQSKQIAYLQLAQRVTFSKGYSHVGNILRFSYYYQNTLALHVKECQAYVLPSLDQNYIFLIVLVRPHFIKCD